MSVQLLTQTQLDELIQLLRGTYPDRAPRQETSPFEQGKTAGHQEMIDYIKNTLGEDHVDNG